MAHSKGSKCRGATSNALLISKNTIELLWLLLYWSNTSLFSGLFLTRLISIKHFTVLCLLDVWTRISTLRSCFMQWHARLGSCKFSFVAKNITGVQLHFYAQPLVTLIWNISVHKIHISQLFLSWYSHFFLSFVVIFTRFFHFMVFLVSYNSAFVRCAYTFQHFPIKTFGVKIAFVTSQRNSCFLWVSKHFLVAQSICQLKH